METENKISKVYKVYLDSSIISNPLKVKNFPKEEMEALRILAKNSQFAKRSHIIKFYTSEKTKREIEQHKDDNMRNYLLFIYDLIERILEENIIKFIPAMFDMVMFDEATFDGSASREDPLFTNLKRIFDKDDAEHIFQAEKSKLDYFLNLDRTTILDRAQEREEELKSLIKICIISPKGLVEKLQLK